MSWQPPCSPSGAHVDNLPARIIMATICKVPKVIPYLTPATFDALKAAEGYFGIRNTYFSDVYDAVYDYLTSNSRVTRFQASMQRAMVQAFGSTVDLAYQDGGGELPLDADTLAWYNDQVNAELGYISDLFDRLREEWQKIDPEVEAAARATGYVSRLDSIYAEAKMRGGKNAVLEFAGDDGKESCPDCKRLKGKRYRAQYIIENNLIPHPGNENFECQGYNCQHYWYNPKTGEEFKP